MKKLYFLLFTFLISAASFGQVILAEDFSYPDGGLVAVSAWENNTGTAGDFLIESGQAVVQHGTPSEDVRITFPSVSGDIYAAFDFSVDDLGAQFTGTDSEYFAHMGFNARVDIENPTGSGDYTIGISTNTSTAQATWASDLTYNQTYRVVVKYDQVGGIADLWLNPANEMDVSISGLVDTTPATITSFDLRQSDSSENETVRVDNLMIGETFNDVLVFTPQTNPSIVLTAPSSGTVFNPGTTNVDVTWTTTNLTNNEFVNVIINIGPPDSVAPSPGIYTVSTTDGTSYNVTVELRDAGNTLLDSDTTSFSVGSLTTVADLAAVRADYNANGPGTFYSVQSTPTVTYTRTSRNQKYIQDASAAILIDDAPGVITTTFSIGSTMSGLVGQVSEFNGVMQFNPTQDATVAGSNTITPEVVTLAQIIANQEDYESELVRINDVTFAAADGTATFAASTSYDIADPSARLLAASTFRTNFSEADYIGQVIPQGAISINTFVGEFNGTPQVTSRALSDIALSTDNFNRSQFSIFPNPTNTGEVNISSVNASPITVNVFDVLGKQVKSETISNNRLNVSNLKSGIYLLRITQDGATNTKKLVIR